ncbi:MAG: hypothetical protein HQ553_08145 [Chloroflexi bacterium]|nr:hypothetical protein [Chloroflexota bacterium]
MTHTYKVDKALAYVVLTKVADAPKPSFAQLRLTRPLWRRRVRIQRGSAGMDSGSPDCVIFCHVIASPSAEGRSNLLGCGEIAASPATPRDDIVTQPVGAFGEAEASRYI